MEFQISLKEYNIGDTINVYSNNIEFEDVLVSIERSKSVYYRHSIIGRNNSVKFLGDTYIVNIECLRMNSGIVFNRHTEDIVRKTIENVEFLDIKLKPEKSKNLISEYNLENFIYSEIESYTDYVLLENDEIKYTITYPYKSIVNEYFLEKNKGIYYNKKYNLVSAKEYNKKIEEYNNANKYDILISEGFIPYTFESYMHTNRQGWKQLILDGKIWNKEESENVIILSSKHSGGGGRYANYSWDLMVRNTVEIGEEYEGDFVELNTNTSNGNNPFEGLSKLFKK